MEKRSGHLRFRKKQKPEMIVMILINALDIHFINN